MTTYKHTLTEIEIACGVTLEQVQDLLPKVLVRNGRVVFLEDTPPALASSVARCAFAAPAMFAGLNSLGMAVYKQEGSQ